MLTTFLDILHIFVCCFLMLVVLLQQGKGGGMGAAFGAGAAQQVFGGRGAGNLLTRATAVCAGIFMLTSVSLAYLSSSGDRALKDRMQQETKKPGKGQEGTPRTDSSKGAGGALPVAPGAGDMKPAGGDKPAETNAAPQAPAPAPASS